MRKQHLWYLDSGCSKHMTRDASKFVSITLKQERHVTYGNNNKGKILGTGTIGNQNNFLIHDVLYVEGLKHNLLADNKKRNHGEEKSLATREEADKLLSVGFIREARYTTWLANIVMVTKPNGKWRMCVDYTNLNRACLKD